MCKTVKREVTILDELGKDKNRARNFLIISNMRSGSTWLQTMLGELSDVVTDYELKWKPAYDLEKIHIGLDHDFEFRNFFESLGNTKVKGSKLTFDFFEINEIEELSDIIPSEVAIIHLTRDYFEILNSFYRGICHNYNDSVLLALKSPIVHDALLRSKKIFSNIKEKTIEEKKREVLEDEAEKHLQIFLSVDEWAHKLSSTNPYFRVDYSEMGEKFFDLVRFIGSDETEQKITSVLKSPPTVKLPHEIVIRNLKQIRALSEKYNTIKLGNTKYAKR